MCWEFHNLPEFAGQDTAAAQQERDEAKAKLRELPSASRLTGLPQQAAGEIRGLWVRGKVVERQLQCVGVRVSDLVRAALMYEQLRHLMGGDAHVCGCDRSEGAGDTRERLGPQLNSEHHRGLAPAL